MNTSHKPYNRAFSCEHGLVLLEDKVHVARVGYLRYPGRDIMARLLRHHAKELELVPIGKGDFWKELGLPHVPRTADLDSNLLFDGNGAGEEPAVQMVSSLIDQGRAMGASDLHLELGHECMRVRFRVEGRLISHDELPPVWCIPCSTRIKVLAHLNIFDRLHPQEGRFMHGREQEQTVLRVSIVPDILGESIVLRYQGRSKSFTRLEDLGLDPPQAHALARNMRSATGGLMVFAGATGSGKTTTIDTLLRVCHQPWEKVISIEDPVELTGDHITRIQTNEVHGLGFADLLGKVLRQDPDVIVLGEVRDSKTADLAVRAALTGHRVLCSLHADQVATIPHRLMDLGVMPWILASTLKLAVCQKLESSASSRTRNGTFEVLEIDEDAMEILAKGELDRTWFRHVFGRCLRNGGVS